MLHPGLLLNERYRLIQQIGKGGFGETWEVELNGQIKVLKVLLDDFPKAIELFKREAQVLSQLQHPGTPSAEADSYFCCTLAGSPEPIHGYVMEKVSGVTLSAWMEARDLEPIDHRLLMDWLNQLLQILRYLHQNGFLHRDIKPSNIMLRDNGQLVLIDFGGVKEAATTQMQNQLGDLTGTRLTTQGYTPNEQLEGHAVAQSDFFALGRTCTYLLTGKHPAKFQSMLGNLLWKEERSSVHPELANFIGELMKPFAHQRPLSAQVILDRLPHLQRVLDNAEPLVPKGQRPLRTRLSSFLYAPSVVPLSARFICAGLSSLATIVVLLALRSSGALQPLELKAYDYLLRLRPRESPDERILVIAVSDEDRAFQESQGLPFRGDSPFDQSVSDTALEKMFDILEKHQPRVVGLDINLDYLRQDDSAESASLNSTSLIERLQKHPKLITGCRVGNIDSYPFPGVTGSRLGFFNLQEDSGEPVVRRHLSHGPFRLGNICKSEYSFSLLLANAYLEKEGVSADPNAEAGFTFYGSQNEAKNNPKDILPSTVVLEDITVSNLPIGGYQKPTGDTGMHLLLNYRAVGSLEKIAPRLSLKQVLTEDFDPALIEDRVVVIGVDRPSDPGNSDYWLTPMGQEISGLMIHTHQLSQLISAVLEDRPLISAKSRQEETLIIIGLTLLGGITAIISTRSTVKSLIYLAISVFFVAVSLTLLVAGWWLPAVPSLLGFTSTYALTTLLSRSSAIRRLTERRV